MHFHVVTIFPDSLRSYLDSSMIFAAQKKKKIKVSVYDPRDYTLDKHKKVDHRPYGGGPGMVMTAQPILDAVDAATKRIARNSKHLTKTRILILSPRGEQFTNGIAKTYAKKYDHLILIAGHYEGIDARVKKITKAQEISVGPYVLTGGELPALVIVDAVTRHVPGVLGDPESLEEKRVASSEVYTRPEIFTYKGKNYKIPTVLKSGDHAKIEAWRKKKAS